MRCYPSRKPWRVCCWLKGQLLLTENRLVRGTSEKIPWRVRTGWSNMAEVSTQPTEKLWESRAPSTSGRTSRNCACTPVDICTLWDPEYHLSYERGTCSSCLSYGSVVMTYPSYEHNCRPGRIPLTFAKTNLIYPWPLRLISSVMRVRVSVFYFTVICEDHSSPFNLLRLQSFGWLVRLVAMTFLQPSSYWYSSIDFSSHIHHNCFKVPTNWPKLPARQFSLPIIHFFQCQCLEAAREGLSLYLSTFVCAHICTQYLPPWNTKPSGNNAQLILLAALQKSTKGIFPLFYGWKTEACWLTEWILQGYTLIPLAAQASHML